VSDRSERPVFDAVDYISAHPPEAINRCKIHKHPDCWVCKNMPMCPHCGLSTSDGHVPTDHPEYRKPDVKTSSKPTPASSFPPLSIFGRTPITPGATGAPSTIPKPYSPPLVTEYCPHSHALVNGKPYCVECLGLGQIVGNFAEFLDRLVDICEKVSWKVTHSAIPREDRRNHAMLSLLLRIDTIAAAKKPEAMAWTIAENSIKDLRRLKYWSECQVQLYSSDDGELESSDDALDRLAFKGAVTKRGGRRARIVNEAPERAFKFSREERRAMCNLLADAFRRIPGQQGFHIRARYGFYPECGKVTLDELASLRNQTKDQIRYSISQGLKNLLTEMLAMIEERCAFLSHAKRKT
jgi:hypothetical protein